MINCKYCAMPINTSAENKVAQIKHQYLSEKNEWSPCSESLIDPRYFTYNDLNRKDEYHAKIIDQQEQLALLNK